MKNISLDGIRSFLAVAENGSFSAAALHLAVTPTAISKAVKALERQHGVLLFQRTTRSSALTEAGASLYAHLAPATAQIDDAFTALTLFRDRPAGTLRLTVPRAFGAIVMARVMPAFRRDFPDVAIDLALDDGTVDLVQQGFDAGIRLGESVQQDMVAVRLTPDLRWSVVAGRPPTWPLPAGRAYRPIWFTTPRCVTASTARAPCTAGASWSTAARYWSTPARPSS